MRKIGDRVAALLLACAATAGTVAPGAAGATSAAGDAWVGKLVRVHFGAHATPAVDGRLMRMDRCLYVRLDAARDGITLVRLDQVRRLQLRAGAGWSAQDVGSVLAREPAHCRAEANG